MPSLNDIVTIAGALGKCPVHAVQDRCVAVRNRNAACRRCTDACGYDAITVRDNEVLIDAGSCIGCGACAVACPTEAIEHVQPRDSELDEAVAKAAELSSGRAVVACSRIASKGKADPSRYAEVPCLARVAESTLLKMAADGASAFLLVDGNCATCKYGSAGGRTEQVMACVNALLEVSSCDVRVRRVSGFPDEMCSDAPAGMPGSTRRGFFADAVDAAKDTAMTAARVSIEERFGSSPKSPDIGQRLRVTEDGTLPQLKMPCHEEALNALYDLGACEASSIESHLFGCVDIDVGTCNACGMCVMFCPTGALAGETGKGDSGDLRQIEFSASDCVQCGLCADVCWKGCLSVQGQVSGEQLFDFEPRVFDVSHAKRPAGAFGGNIGSK